MLLAGTGDRAACAVLFERHRDRVRALARRLQCRGDADDVAQDVFLRVWRAAPSWRPRARFETWLRCVTVNVCRDRVRKRHEVPCDVVPEIADTAQDPSRDMYGAEIGRRLVGALARLPEAQRAAIVLSYYRGLRRRDAAVVMDLSTEAFESLLSRARRALQIDLRTLGDELRCAARSRTEGSEQGDDDGTLRAGRSRALASNPAKQDDTPCDDGVACSVRAQRSDRLAGMRRTAEVVHAPGVRDLVFERAEPVVRRP